MRARVSGIRLTREPVVACLDDGEADAVHGDRALVDQVAAELGRHGHVDDLPVLAGRAGGDGADAVDVTLDDVAAEPGGRGDRALEVDPVARLDAGEAGLVERLLHDVGGPGVAVALGDGEAAAVDGDRVAQPGIRQHVLGVDGEPDGIALVLDPGDGAELFDDPGEHQLSPGCMVRRTFGCSPSRPSSTVTSVTTGRSACGDGGDSQVGDGLLAGAEQHRGDVGDDLVDQPGPQERRGEGRAALEEDVLAVPGEQRLQRGLGVAGAQVQRLGMVVEDPLGSRAGRARP